MSDFKADRIPVYNQAIRELKEEGFLNEKVFHGNDILWFSSIQHLWNHFILDISKQINID